MINKTLIALLAAAMAVTAVHAEAQDKPAGGGHRMPAFTDVDKNADGGISREEFQAFRSARIRERAEEGRRMKNLAEAPSFEDIDTDGNGSINGQEFRTHQAAQRAKMQKQKMKQKNPQQKQKMKSSDPSR